MSGEANGESARLENALQLVQELFGDDNEEFKDEQIDEGQNLNEEVLDDQEHLFGDDGQQEDQDIDEEEDDEDEMDENDDDNQEENDEGQQEAEKPGEASQTKGKDKPDVTNNEEQDKKAQGEKNKFNDSDDDEDEIVLKTVVPKVKATETVVPQKKKSFKKSKSPHESTKRQKSNKHSSQRKSHSRSRSRSNSKDRSLFCCSRCKKNDKGGRTCICLVPPKDRRISIDQSGCQPCGCKGCSKGKPVQKKERSRSPVEQFEMKNGCCRQCLKAFSKNGKACLCQVPEKVRKTELGRNGCKYCGCKGCNPEDTRAAPVFESRDEKRKGYSRERGGQVSTTGGQSRQGDSSNSNNRSRVRSYSRERRTSPSRRDDVNAEFPVSAIQDILQNDLHVYPPLVGFFVPHRSYSYITGKSSDPS